MASFVPGNVLSAPFNTPTLDLIELRVISQLLQNQSGSANQEELRQLRNDNAFDLGIVPPVVPGA
jgi:hypothetical protein